MFLVWILPQTNQALYFSVVVELCRPVCERENNAARLTNGIHNKDSYAVKLRPVEVECVAHRTTELFKCVLHLYCFNTLLNILL